MCIDTLYVFKSYNHLKTGGERERGNGTYDEAEMLGFITKVTDSGCMT